MAPAPRCFCRNRFTAGEVNGRKPKEGATAYRWNALKRDGLREAIIFAVEAVSRNNGSVLVGREELKSYRVYEIIYDIHRRRESNGHGHRTNSGSSPRMPCQK